MVGYGFSRALDARSSFVVATAPVGRQEKSVVGDEAYWLSSGETMASPVVLGNRLAIGDRIGVTGKDGRTRTLEVVAIKYVGAPVLSVADDGAAVRLMRVTFRVVESSGGESAGDKGELVHVLLEVGVNVNRPADLRAQGPSGRT
jgi:hypothetical protein